MCKSWYCSPLCQANHWAVHRKECIPIPSLEWPDGTRYQPQGQVERLDASENISPCQKGLADQEPSQGSRQSQTPLQLQSTTFTPSSSIGSRSACVEPVKVPSSVRSHCGIPPPQSQGTGVPSSVSLLSEHSEAYSKVSCVCMNTQPDTIMLDCHLCSFQQHASCYRIFSVNNIPTKHCCVTCSKQNGISCTDNELVKMSSNPTVIGTCLFRRALFLLLEVELITVDVVAGRLGFGGPTSEAIFDKLGGEGCLEDHEVEGQWRVLKKVLESKTIPKFIGRKGKKSNVGEGVVKGGSQDGGLYGNASDTKDRNLNTKKKGAKCSVVADVHQLSECGEKRRLIELEKGEGEERISKRKKEVSEVKGDLQI